MWCLAYNYTSVVVLYASFCFPLWFFRMVIAELSQSMLPARCVRCMPE